MARARKRRSQQKGPTLRAQQGAKWLRGPPPLPVSSSPSPHGPLQGPDAVTEAGQKARQVCDSSRPAPRGCRRRAAVETLAVIACHLAGLKAPLALLHLARSRASTPSPANASDRRPKQKCRAHRPRRLAPAPAAAPAAATSRPPTLAATLCCGAHRRSPAPLSAQMRARACTARHSRVTPPTCQPSSRSPCLCSGSPPPMPPRGATPPVSWLR